MIAVSVSESIVAATALIIGETPKRSLENKFSGSVVEPTPETKKLSTKSSNEKVNASNPPASTAG